MVSHKDKGLTLSPKQANNAERAFTNVGVSAILDYCFHVN